MNSVFHSHQRSDQTYREIKIHWNWIISPSCLHTLLISMWNTFKNRLQVSENLKELKSCHVSSQKKEINNKNTSKLDNMLLIINWSFRKFIKEIKKLKIKWNHNISKHVRYSKSRKRKVYNTVYIKKREMSQTKDLLMHHEDLNIRKNQTTNQKVVRNNRAEINEPET